MEEIGFLIRQIISLFIQPLDTFATIVGWDCDFLFKKSRWIGLDIYLHWDIGIIILFDANYGIQPFEAIGKAGRLF